MASRRSYIGAKVKLRRGVVTQGGVKFAEGTTMRCVDSTSGGLTLRCYRRGCQYAVYGLRKYDVTVVEWPKKDDQ